MRSSELRELLQSVSIRYGIDTMTHFYLVHMKHRPASILIFRNPDEIENVRRILRLLNATIAKYPVGAFAYLIFLNTDENRTIYEQIKQSYNPANKSTNRVELDTLTGTFLGYLTPKPLRNLQFPGRIATHITVNTNIKSFQIAPQIVVDMSEEEIREKMEPLRKGVEELRSYGFLIDAETDVKMS